MVHASTGMLAIRSILILCVVILGYPDSRALAQQPNSHSNAVLKLVQVVCEAGASEQVIVDLNSGYMPMMGLTDAIHSMRVLRSDNREVMIPVEQCRDVQPAKDLSTVLILSHFFNNPVQLREGYYYLTTLRGDLLKAVHLLEGRSNLFALAPLMPVRRADFEGEKSIWLTRLGAGHTFVQYRPQ